MNPQTDRITQVPDGRGGLIEIRQPGALLTGSSNWRYKREAYDKYEPFLIAGLANWPTETSFDVPAGLSPNTFIRCFREARYALLVFGYNPDLAAKMKAVNDQFTIALDPDGKKAWFRAVGQRGRRPRAEKLEVQAMKRPLFVSNDIQAVPSATELRAICLLLQSKRVSGPFHFQGRIDAALLAEIEGSYDVAFAWDELTGVTTLL